MSNLHMFSDCQSLNQSNIESLPLETYTFYTLLLYALSPNSLLNSFESLTKESLIRI